MSPEPSSKLLIERRKRARQLLESEGVQFQKTLGSGSFGEVSSAKVGQTEQAVKICHFAFEDETPLALYVKREYDLLQDLHPLTRHPYIISLFAYKTVELSEANKAISLPVTFWELAETTLTHRRHIFTDHSHVLDCLAKVADAVDHLHKNGYRHRDIKPGNILYNDSDGFPRLGDLGLAKSDVSLIGVATLEVNLQEQEFGMPLPVPGTPGFAPPERFHHPHVSHPSWDLYSLAVVYTWLRTGRLPWGDYKSSKELLGRQMDRDFIAHELASLALNKRHVSAVAAALDPDPEKRPQITASAWIMGLRIASHSASPPEASPPGSQHNVNSGPQSNSLPMPEDKPPDQYTLLEQLKKLQPQGKLKELMLRAGLRPEDWPDLPTHRERCLACLTWANSENKLAEVAELLQQRLRP